MVMAWSQWTSLPLWAWTKQKYTRKRNCPIKTSRASKMSSSKSFSMRLTLPSSLCPTESTRTIFSGLVNHMDPGDFQAPVSLVSIIIHYVPFRFDELWGLKFKHILFIDITCQHFIVCLHIILLLRQIEVTNSAQQRNMKNTTKHNATVLCLVKMKEKMWFTY